MCSIINSCALSKTLPHSGEDLVIFSASVEASLVVWKRLYLVGVNRKCFLCVHQATIIQDPVLMFTVCCLQKCLGQSSAPLCSWTARLVWLDQSLMRVVDRRRPRIYSDAQKHRTVSLYYWRVCRLSAYEF